RWIVVDQARRRSAAKRGGGLVEVTLSERISGKSQDEEVLALHEGLDALDAISPRRREIVALRYFGAFESRQRAELIGGSERTAKREWAHARAFLHAWLAESVWEERAGIAGMRGTFSRGSGWTRPTRTRGARR